MVEKGAGISGATLTVMDNQYDYMRTHPTWPNEFTNKGVNDRITLKYTGENKKVYGQPWTISVNFTLKSWDAAGVERPSVSGNLSINYHPAQGASYKDIDVFTIDGGYKTQLIIAPVSLPTGFTSLPTDVVIESLIETERYFKLDPNAAVPVTYTVDPPANTMEMQWPFIKGAEEYDVEWVFVSDARLHLQPIDRPVYEMANATRISTSKNFYKINLIYDGDGTVYFRVRGVGRKGSTFQLRQEGKWSVINSYHLTGYSKDRNWTYTVNYAEEGKSIEAASFFDGSGRNRQAVTKLNSENTALAAETMYDFEGRPGVQTLPAPVNNFTKLGFYQQYSLNPTGVLYTAKDFDNDAYLTSPDCKPVGGVGMSTAKGASNYYSDQNPLKEKGFNGALPDAELYPFLQTVYDKEGQVKMQSGPGATHRIGAGHETKYFNATVSQDNLDRLFGADIGKASHYSQKATMDPNGQLSVSYLDLSGNVVASFLTGDNTTHLDDLSGSTATIDESLTELNELTEEALIIDAKFLVTSSSEYTFTYKLDEAHYQNMCEEVPHTCVYDLLITIYDDCDQPVYDQNGSILAHHFVISGPDTKIFKVDFPRIGVYKIRKKLTINQLALDIAVADFKAFAPGVCFPTLKQIVDDYKDKVVSDECNPTTCEEDCKTEATAANLEPGSPQWKEYVANCKLAKFCTGTPETSCDAILKQIEKDMSPGGQYFNYVVSVSWPIEVAYYYDYSATWPFCDLQAWRIANFKDKTGNLITSFEDLQTNWDPTFLYKKFDGSGGPEGCNTPYNNSGAHTIAGKDQLIKFHPEYCHYEWCGKLEQSTEFDMKLFNYDSYKMAETFPTTAPYLGGSPVGKNILEADPYFLSPLLGSDQKAAMEALLSDMDGGGPLGNMFTEAGTIAGCTLCDEQWQTFRNFYISRKAQLIRTKEISEGCGFICDNSSPPDNIGDDCEGANRPLYRDKQIRFPYPNEISNPSTDENHYQDLVDQLEEEYGVDCGGEGQPPCYNEHHCLCDQLANWESLYNYKNPVTNDWVVNRIDFPTVGLYLAVNLNRHYNFVKPGVLCSDTLTANNAEYLLNNCKNSDNQHPINNNAFVPTDLFAAGGDTICGNRWQDILECDKIPECELPDSTIFIYYANEQYQEYMNKAVEDFITGYKAKCLRTGLETFDVNHQSKEYQYTLYYYDRAGNLEKTVPPEGVRVLTSTQLIAMRNYRRNVPGSAPVYPEHILLTKYNYNSFDKLIAQSSPDGGSANFWYNDVGQLRFSRNLKQVLSTNDIVRPYSYTKYDKQGRVIEVGESQQAPPQVDPELTGPIPVYSLDLAVNDPNFPLFGRREVTHTYYDAQINTNINQFPYTQRNLRSSVATVCYEDEGDDNKLTYNHATHYSYDNHGNVNLLLQDHPVMAEVTDRIKKTEYEYDLISGNVNKISYQKGAFDQFYHRYSYDEDNRLTAVYTSADNITWSNDAKYYYYLHGALARMELGEKKVQGLDYAHTIQGWIKGVNNSRLDALQDIGKDGIAGSKYDASQNDLHRNIGRDAFGYSLHYYTDDYKSILTRTASEKFLADVEAININRKGNDLYTGNIKMKSTALLKKDVTGLPVPMPLAVSHYRYDQLNRITSAEYQVATNNEFASATAVDDYGSTYDYDGNGNIQTLLRHTSAALGLDMDELAYRYDNIDPLNPGLGLKSNRLMHVQDFSSSANDGEFVTQDQPGNAYDPADPSTWNYQYDAIGNLIKDKSNHNEKIEWTLYGKIKSITHEGATATTKGYSDLEFAYDAGGNRVMKIEKPRIPATGALSNENQWITTYYVRDVQGNIMSTYKKSFDVSGNQYIRKFRQGEVNLYGNGRLGVYNNPMSDQTKLFTITGFNEHKFEGIYYIPEQIFNPCMDLICPLKYNRILGAKNYELNDQLGNVATVVSDNILPVDEGTIDGNADYYLPDLVSVNDYYPFGSPMNGRGYNPGSYRYGFNGKENDKEALGTGHGTQDYGFRIYNPSLGKFLSVDPLSPKYPELTPYQFASNTPIHAIDLDGLESCEGNALRLDAEHLHMTRQEVIESQVGKTNALGHMIVGTVDGVVYASTSVASSLVAGFSYGAGHEIRLPAIGFSNERGFAFEKAELGERVSFKNGMRMMSGVTTITSLGGGIWANEANVALRQMYISEVEGLSGLSTKLLNNGYTEKTVAKTLNTLRRNIGIKYKDMTPPDLLDYIYKFNVKRYGDKLGPTYDYLKALGKTDTEIINSSSKVLGTQEDLGKALYKMFGEEIKPILEKYNMLPKAGN
jgi:RHS repeat-associated protein